MRSSANKIQLTGFDDLFQAGGEAEASGERVQEVSLSELFPLTYEQEAELYYKLDQAKGRLRLSSATKALLESGSNAEIVDVKRRIEDAGFVWALDKTTSEPFEITATRAVISAYHLLGGAAFSRMLGLIARAWHGTPSSLKASIFSGMALFVKTYETELADQTFIKRLSIAGLDKTGGCTWNNVLIPGNRSKPCRFWTFGLWTPLICGTFGM